MKSVLTNVIVMMRGHRVAQNTYNNTKNEKDN